MDATVVPAFEPHPWFQGGHFQTIAGRYLPGRSVRLPATYHEVPLSDGDRISVLDSIPGGWRNGHPGAVLVHGLGGCARAAYVVRLADRLVRLGIRVVRMNLRGAGAGFGSARGVYHAGRTGDLRAVVQWLACQASDSPLALIGYSLGASLALKLAAEAASEPVAGLECVLAANPPLDLEACSRHIHLRQNRIYERSFMRGVKSSILRHHAAYPETGLPDLVEAGTLLGFDSVYTAPRHGYAGAAEYYAQSSAGPCLRQIEIEGLIVHAEDDPFIPVDSVRAVQVPAQIEFRLVPAGGHLGYIARDSDDVDRRWLDAQLAGWLTARWKSFSD